MKLLNIKSMRIFSPSSKMFWDGFPSAVAVLSVILSIVFYKSFLPEMVLFSNDGPLGVMVSSSLSVPEGFSGVWNDLYFLGSSGGTLPISVSYIILWIFGPIGWAKFYAPISLLLFGLSAWIFCKTITPKSNICLVLGIAAALNGNFLSNAAWGLASRSLTCMWVLLALTCLRMEMIGRDYFRLFAWAMISGICIGNSIVEGADNGVFFSLFFSAYVLFQSIVEGNGWKEKIILCFRLPLIVSFSFAAVSQTLGILIKFASR